MWSRHQHPSDNASGNPNTACWPWWFGEAGHFINPMHYHECWPRWVGEAWRGPFMNEAQECLWHRGADHNLYKSARQVQDTCRSQHPWRRSVPRARQSFPWEQIKVAKDEEEHSDDQPGQPTRKIKLRSMKRSTTTVNQANPQVRGQTSRSHDG